jgi:nucleoside-diphosphate-sugar epimerase
VQNTLSGAPLRVPPKLLIFGLGYSATAIAMAAREAGFQVTGTRRNPTQEPDVVGFHEAGHVLQQATHVLSSVPPDAEGDPVLAQYGAALSAAPHLRWIGYLSTTGVYGNRDGAWVDETTAPSTESARGQRRVTAEQAWAKFSQNHQGSVGQQVRQHADKAAAQTNLGSVGQNVRQHADKAAAQTNLGSVGQHVDIFRLAGIYGPGRSVFDDLRAGRARRVLKPGHAFGRIHRDDIAAAVLAAMQQDQPTGGPCRILNLTDNLPAESAEVLEEAANLLGVPPPPAIPFAEALAEMSPMARSFWADNRRVSSQATQQALGLTWRYPTYREGLRAILAEERLHGGT